MSCALSACESKWRNLIYEVEEKYNQKAVSAEKINKKN